jgi:hypothetical protein
MAKGCIDGYRMTIPARVNNSNRAHSMGTFDFNEILGYGLVESVRMFPLFLHCVKPLPHFLEPLVVLLLHLRSHGAAHLLLHLV